MKKFLYALAFTIILVVNGFRFYNLENIPYGFQVDELGSAVTIQCLATEGVDATGARYPVFSYTHFGTPKPATYIYPGALWTKLFGFSIGSFRGLTAFFFIFGLLGLFLLCRLLIDRRYAFLVIFLASLSPWAWMFSRLSVESLLSPVYLIWGLYFFFRKEQWYNFLLAGIFLTFATYTYPPTRAQLPLMILPLLLFRRHFKGLRLSSMAIFIATLAVMSLPLIIRTLDHSLQERFNQISIFAPDYLKSIGKTNSLQDLLGIFISNYLLHFDFRFLFLTGDQSLMHSTQHFGELSWIDDLGLILMLLYAGLFLFKAPVEFLKKDKALLLFFVINILIGILPAAFTQSNYGLPHALRTIGAWPFVEMTSAYFIYRACEQWKYSFLIVLILGAFFITSFLKIYFGTYVQESQGQFSPWDKIIAKSAKTEEDWIKFVYILYPQDYTVRYYLMNYHKDSCTESEIRWEKIRNFAITQQH